MPRPLDQASGSWPEELRYALLRRAKGEIPANVGLAQIIMTAEDAKQAREALEEAAAEFEKTSQAEASRLRDVQALWEQTPDAFETVSRVLAIEREASSGRSGAGRWGKVFDEAFRASPEASVAAYSLGRTDLLAAASEEIVTWMRRERLIASNCIVLEIGCGIGRLLPLLAREVQFIAATEISAEMARAARARCSGLANAAIIRTGGRDLAAIVDARFDLVLAIDVFPYLFRCGHEVVQRHFAEAARVLKPKGALLLFNFSYRGDLARDRADIADLSARFGFAVLRNGAQELRLWDAAIFQLCRNS